MPHSALVTGSANGIGRALAVALARRGYALTVSRGAALPLLMRSYTKSLLVQHTWTRDAPSPF